MHHTYSEILLTFSCHASTTPRRKSKPGEQFSAISPSSTRRTLVANTTTFSRCLSRTAGTARTTSPSLKTCRISSKIARVSRYAPWPDFCRHAISSLALRSASSTRLSTFVIRQNHSTHPNPMSFMSFWDTRRCLPTRHSHSSHKKLDWHPLELLMTTSNDLRHVFGSQSSTECVVRTGHSKVIATVFSTIFTTLKILLPCSLWRWPVIKLWRT